ncbi:hypothetical protein Godav_022355 [Gossypium davidsonii]|uniref:Uncharacterized protein n=1 Tax=Gossypium davidsonii TaxID=34287 RepID=A0A7J8TIN3_GOSDV|nr:hypothetical protein [Gossypium davidsonii]
MISRRKNGWQFFRIFKKRISNGELLGCFQVRSYIDVVMVIRRRFERCPMPGIRLDG